eukprot:3833077-Pyramimonas_sp.AAC.2
MTGCPALLNLCPLFLLRVSYLSVCRNASRRPASRARLAAMGKPKKHTDAGASDKKRKAQDEPEVDHPLLNVRMATCTTCNQNTHGYEKHAPEGVKQPLWWPKGEKCAKT